MSTLTIIAELDELGQADMIAGAGETSEAAWEQVKEIFGSDHDFDATDYREYEATDDLMTLLNREGGACSWDVTDDGVADICRD